MSRKTIRVEALARIEGESGIQVTVQGGKVGEVKLKVFEPPRLFEGFLRGRKHTEAPDITARICGICPVAYIMSSVRAMEDALGVRVDGALQDLRRLLYLGEWIESHALHVYLLHAPDFLGYESGLHMAADYPDAVARGLRLKKIGNDIVTRVGGREIHPVNVRVGGFYRTPSAAELRPLVEDLKWACAAAEETVRWTAGLSFPELERDYEFVALRSATEYAIDEGRIASNRGIDTPAAGFLEHFEEVQVPHSTSLHAKVKKRGPYLVGPLARYALGSSLLSERARAAARAAGLGDVCWNPFRSIVVRSVETLHACEQALRIVEGYQPPPKPAVDYAVRAGTGHGATEAPRGILYHRYTIDAAGLIADARIIPPTAQNQSTIEEDVRAFVEAHADLPDDQLQWQCEQAVRNHDPCISCSCHALRARVRRAP